MRTAREWRAHRRALVGVALALVVVCSPVAIGGVLAASHVGSLPAPATGAIVSLPSVSHHVGLQLPRAVGPQVGPVWYTQVGATLAQLNGSALVTGAATLTLTIPVVSSPYPIGYELNGVSNSGDWYQVLVGDNWPSCPGYEMLYEVWDNTGAPGPVGCDTTVTISTGDSVRLGLNFTPAHNVCLDLTDITRSHAHSVCQAQPNGGGNRFVPLSTNADANGYFTGPMTEIANTSASACPDYTHMPLVNYQWMKGLYVTGMIAWSDEFELGGSQISCYVGGGSLTSFYPGDPATYVTDTAGGTPYGPHYVAGQNFSMVDGSYGFRMQTDVPPMSSVSLVGSPTTIAQGGTSNLTATVSGGAPPYTALWSLNGTIFANGSLTHVFVGTSGGPYTFHAFGVDSRLDVIGPSNAVVIMVNAPLGTPAVRVASPTGGADVGQLVAINALVSGGIPGYSYQWSGLPNECPGTSSPTIWCTPVTSSTYNVTVTVRDQNGTTRTSPSTVFIVSPALGASLSLSGAEVDLNQSFQAVLSWSGGSGPSSFAWAGLPTGCPGGNISRFICTPTATGFFPISGSVTDRNGFTAISATAGFRVHSALSASFLVNRVAFDAGVNVTYTARVSGGAGNLSFAWQGVPPNCVPGNRSSFSCAASVSGSYPVTLTVSDPLGSTVHAGPTVIYVYPALQIRLMGPATGFVGSTIVVTATLSGGSGQPTFRWAGVPDGCSAPAGQNFSCGSAQAGTYTLTLTVTDVGGGGTTAWFNLTVTDAPGVTSEIPGWAGVAIVAAIAIAVVVVALAVRRRRGAE